MKHSLDDAPSARTERLKQAAVSEEAQAIIPRTLVAEIEQACRAHDLYLAEYGSLGEAVRAEASQQAANEALPRP